MSGRQSGMGQGQRRVQLQRALWAKFHHLARRISDLAESCGPADGFLSALAAMISGSPSRNGAKLFEKRKGKSMGCIAGCVAAHSTYSSKAAICDASQACRILNHDQRHSPAEEGILDIAAYVRARSMRRVLPRSTSYRPTRLHWGLARLHVRRSLLPLKSWKSIRMVRQRH